tara:strand:+ start:1085 stop:2191 length:1107 start_codon:yes stop_codon:yes gene_type:complete
MLEKNIKQITQKYKQFIDSPKISNDIKYFTKNTSRVAALLIGGGELMEQYPNGPSKDALAGVIATYTASGAVKTKLKSQKETLNGNTPSDFLINETKSAMKNFNTVWFKENAFNGALVYSMRGGITKALMFVGYDNIYPELKNQHLNNFAATALAGLSSGALQGFVTSIPEWIATKQATEHDKKTTEHVKEIFNYLKNSSIPITSQIARNAVFDSVFFILTKYYGIKLAIAAPIAMTASYQLEKIRSLSQQGKLPKDIKEVFEKGDKKNRYTGWFSKAIEFSIVYALLDYFRQKGSPKQDTNLKSNQLNLELIKKTINCIKPEKKQEIKKFQNQNINNYEKIKTISKELHTTTISLTKIKLNDLQPPA